VPRFADPLKFFREQKDLRKITGKVGFSAKRRPKKLVSSKNTSYLALTEGAFSYSKYIFLTNNILVKSGKQQKLKKKNALLRLCCTYKIRQDMVSYSPLLLGQREEKTMSQKWMGNNLQVVFDLIFSF
jgi:hypothetical protein